MPVYRKRLVRLVKREVTCSLEATWPPSVYRVLLFLCATCDADNWIAGTHLQWSRACGLCRQQVTEACAYLQRAGLLEFHPRRANGTHTWHQTTAWRLSTRLVRPYTAPWWIRARWQQRARQGG